MSDSRRLALGALLLVVVVAGVYAPGLRNGFVEDDASQIVAGDSPASLAVAFEVFDGDAWRDVPYYRPLPRSTLVAQRWLHGSGAGGYHALNVLAAVLLALSALALLTAPGFRLPFALAWFGAALFALHPIASTAVHPISSGRSISIPVVAIVAAVAAWARGGSWQRFAAPALVVVALAARESALVLPALFVLCDLGGISNGRDASGTWVRRFGPVAVIVALYLVLRWALPGAAHGLGLALVREPAALPLSLLYTLQSIFDPSLALFHEPRFAVWFAPGHLVVVLAVSAAIAFVAVRSWSEVGRRVIFWIGWTILALAANLVAHEARFVERELLLASLGPIGVVLVLSSVGWRRPLVRRFCIGGGVLLLISCAFVSIHRGRYYHDELTFLKRWVLSDPQAARAHHGLGQYHYARQEWDDAERYFEQALRNDPDYATAHSNLGAILAMRDDLERAADHLGRAVKLDPGMYEAHVNLGRLLARQDRLELAATHLERALKIDPSAPAVRFSLAEVYLGLGDVRRAQAQLELTVHLAPEHAPAHFHLGSMYFRAQDTERARHHFESAVAADPGHAPAHNNLGIVLAQAGDGSRARFHFEQALGLDPDHVRARVNYANLLLAQNEREKALAELERALEIDPGSVAARESLERARGAAAPR